LSLIVNNLQEKERNNCVKETATYWTRKAWDAGIR